MKMIKTAGMALVAASAVFSANSAVALTLNFDFTDRAETNPITAEVPAIAPGLFSDFGMTITGFDLDDNAKPLALYDSSCQTGCQDGDLATGPNFDTDPQGFVLILNQDNAGVPFDPPNDDADGGYVNFDYAGSLILQSVFMLDLDEESTAGEFPFFVEVSYTNGTSEILDYSAVTLLNPSFPGDNSLRRFDFGGFDPVSSPLGGVASVSSFDVVFDDVSGAIGAIYFEQGGGVSAVPLPAGLPLVLSGFGALLLAGRRKKA